MKKVMIELSGKVSHTFEIVNNYVSNVKAQIINKEVITGNDGQTITYFTLEVSLDAKFGDNLQQEIDLYDIYNYLANEKYKDETRFLPGVSKTYMLFREMVDKVGIKTVK